MKLVPLILAFAISPLMAHAQKEIAGAASVIDGDTIEIHGERIRLYGIDAPEVHQICHFGMTSYLCGERSADALDAKLLGKIVSCQMLNHDRYKRAVSRCVVDGSDVNSWMVEQGLAVAYEQYSHDYVLVEDAARARHIGLWAGTFENPADYRRDQRARLKHPQIPPMTSCLIKGNISTEDKRLYHLPGSDAYDRTHISTRKGERWFCSEEDAIIAGWKKAR